MLIKNSQCQFDIRHNAYFFVDNRYLSCSPIYLSIFGLIFRVFVSQSWHILCHKQDFVRFVL